MINIETLRTEFLAVSRISEESHRKITAILNKASDEFILEVMKAKVNFVSSLAINHACRRGLLA